MRVLVGRVLIALGAVASLLSAACGKVPAQDTWADLLRRAEAADQNAVQRDAADEICAIELRNLVPVDDALAGLTASPALTRLGLDGTDVTDAGMRGLATLAGLDELRLANTRVTDTGLASLTGAVRLGKLDLTATEITGPGLDHLAACPLTWLRLDGSPVIDAGLAPVSRLSGLRGLFLNGTRITDAGVALLSGLPGLQHLELRHTDVGDAGLAKLAQIGTLETLNLAGTEITDAGIPSLKMLPKLRFLDVRGTAVTPAGLECLRDLPALAEVGVTVVGPGGLKPLAALSRITNAFLDLRGVPEAEVSAYYAGGRSGGMSQTIAPSPEEARRDAERFQALLAAAIAAPDGALDLSSKADSGQPGPRSENRLEGVVLNFWRLTPEMLDGIAGAGKIRRLNLGGVPMNDRMMRRLAGMKGLLALRVASGYEDTDFGTRLFESGVRDRGLTLLAGNPDLEDLNLWGTRVGGPALEAIEMMTHLRALDLGYTFISGARLRHLKNCTALQTLSLEHTRTFDSDLTYLAPLVRVEHLNLAATRITDAAVTSLSAMKSLRTLDLRGTRVSAAAVATLKAALPEVQVVPAEGAPADTPAPGPRRSDMW